MKKWDDLAGKTMRSWAAWDPQKKTEETWKPKKILGKYCTKGTKSKLNCYEEAGPKLLRHNKAPWITGKLQKNGVIVWSHGYRSAPVSGPCAVDEVEPEEDAYQPTCKVGWDQWRGGSSWSFKTGGKASKVEDVHVTTKGMKKSWCFHGLASGKHCLKQAGSRLWAKGGVYGDL